MDLNTYLADRRVSRAEFCRLIKAHAPDLTRWLSRDRPVPPVTCAVIEIKTDGAVTCEELRPDVRWHRVADVAWPHPQGRPLIEVAAAAEPAPAAEEAKAA